MHGRPTVTPPRKHEELPPRNTRKTRNLNRIEECRIFAWFSFRAFRVFRGDNPTRRLDSTLEFAREGCHNNLIPPVPTFRDSLSPLLDPAVSTNRETDMTPLRKRMIDELVRRNYGDRTIKTYVGAVAAIARRFKKSRVWIRS